MADVVFKINKDYYGNMEKPQLRLATPYKDYIGNGVLNLNELPKLSPKYNNLSTMDLKIYQYKDGVENPLYDQIENGKLIEYKGLAWFRINEVQELQDGNIGYKEISCYSLESELVGRRVFDIDGVFDLYNITDTEHSLLHIICNQMGNLWSIGHVDNELIGKARTFKIDSKEIYSLLQDDVAKSFECIFQFDTYNREINAITITNAGEDTNITLTYKNLVEQNLIKTSLDNITTVFKVTGGDNFDIRAVNPTGSNKITNLSYYMNSDWMSDELISAYTTYNLKCQSVTSQSTTALAQLKLEYAELQRLNEAVPDPTKGESETDWTKYGYNQLQIKYNENDVVATTLAKAGASNSNDAQYPLYLARWNTMQAISSEMTIRKQSINTQQAIITSIETTLSNLASTLSMSVNFTPEQIEELNSFYKEGDYIDETFVENETDTPEDILIKKQELLKIASEELTRVSQPQYTIDTTIGNLFMLDEFKVFQDEFILGNTVRIYFRDDLYVTARLLEIDVDLENPDKLGVVFSNMNKLDSDTIALAKIQAQSEANNTIIQYGGLSWNDAAKKTPTFESYITNPLNLATQSIKDTNNAEVTIGYWGIRNRYLDPNTGLYDRHESWWTGNNLLFSDDNFKSSRLGIGLFKDPITHSEYYGVLADVLVGRMIVGESLQIINKAGNFSISNDGFIATNGIYSVGINPNIPSEIFNVKVNGEKKLYVDTVNNKLAFIGDIIGSSFIGGSIQSSNYVYNSSGMRIDLTNGTIDSKNFKTDVYGGVTLTSANVSGNITADSGSISGFTIFQNELEAGSGTKYIRLSPRRSLTTDGGYDTRYAAIDLGKSGNDTIIHLRSDGYARFGLASLNGSVRFNYKHTDGIDYSFYTPDLSISTVGMITVGNLTSRSTGFTISGLYDMTLMCNRDMIFDTQQDVKFYCDSATINGSEILTGNIHSSSIYVTDPSDLTDAGNINMIGANAATPTWCADTFQPKSTSDIRLKHDIKKLDIPTELFLELKPYQFKLKPSDMDNKIRFGLMAQELELLFKRYGLDPKDYNLIEDTDVRKYTDEGMYCTDGIVKRVNYENLIALIIDQMQKIFARLSIIETKIL